MITRLLKIARGGLLIWGALSLVGVMSLAALTVYRASFGNRDQIDKATPHDVRFVLNWCELGDERIEKVEHSHVSSRSFTGDHLDAYAIKISHVELAELSQTTDRIRERWVRGDQLPAVLDEAVGFVSAWRHEIPWFPSEKQLRSSEFYVYSWSTTFHGLRPTAAKLIFIRPSDQMIFYFSGKT